MFSINHFSTLNNRRTALKRITDLNALSSNQNAVMCCNYTPQALTNLHNLLIALQAPKRGGATLPIFANSSARSFLKRRHTVERRTKPLALFSLTLRWLELSLRNRRYAPLKIQKRAWYKILTNYWKQRRVLRRKFLTKAVFNYTKLMRKINNTFSRYFISTPLAPTNVEWNQSTPTRLWLLEKQFFNSQLGSIAFAPLTEDLADYHYEQAFNWVQKNRLSIFKNQKKLTLLNHPTKKVEKNDLQTLSRRAIPMWSNNTRRLMSTKGTLSLDAGNQHFYHPVYWNRPPGKIKVERSPKSYSGDPNRDVTAVEAWVDLNARLRLANSAVITTQRVQRVSRPYGYQLKLVKMGRQRRNRRFNKVRRRVSRFTRYKKRMVRWKKQPRTLKKTFKLSSPAEKRVFYPKLLIQQMINSTTLDQKPNVVGPSLELPSDRAESNIAITKWATQFIEADNVKPARSPWEAFNAAQLRIRKKPGKAQKPKPKKKAPDAEAEWEQSQTPEGWTDEDWEAFKKRLEEVSKDKDDDSSEDIPPMPPTCTMFKLWRRRAKLLKYFLRFRFWRKNKLKRNFLKNVADAVQPQFNTPLTESQTVTNLLLLTQIRTLHNTNLSNIPFKQVWLKFGNALQLAHGKHQKAALTKSLEFTQNNYAFIKKHINIKTRLSIATQQSTYLKRLAKSKLLNPRQIEKPIGILKATAKTKARRYPKKMRVTLKTAGLKPRRLRRQKKSRTKYAGWYRKLTHQTRSKVANYIKNLRWNPLMFDYFDDNNYIFKRPKPKAPKRDFWDEFSLLSAELYLFQEILHQRATPFNKSIVDGIPLYDYMYNYGRLISQKLATTIISDIISRTCESSGLISFLEHFSDKSTDREMFYTVKDFETDLIAELLSHHTLREFTDALLCNEVNLDQSQLKLNNLEGWERELEPLFSLWTPGSIPTKSYIFWDNMVPGERGTLILQKVDKKTHPEANRLLSSVEMFFRNPKHFKFVTPLQIAKAKAVKYSSQNYNEHLRRLERLTGVNHVYVLSEMAEQWGFDRPEVEIGLTKYSEYEPIIISTLHKRLKALVFNDGDDSSDSEIPPSDNGPKFGAPELLSLDDFLIGDWQPSNRDERPRLEFVQRAMDKLTLLSDDEVDASVEITDTTDEESSTEDLQPDNSGETNPAFDETLELSDEEHKVIEQEKLKKLGELIGQDWGTTIPLTKERNAYTNFDDLLEMPERFTAAPAAAPTIRELIVPAQVRSPVFVQTDHTGLLVHKQPSNVSTFNLYWDALNPAFYYNNLKNKLTSLKKNYCLKTEAPQRYRPNKNPNSVPLNTAKANWNSWNWLEHLLNVVQIKKRKIKTPIFVPLEQMKWAKKVLLNNTRLAWDYYHLEYKASEGFNYSVVTIYEQVQKIIFSLPPFMQKNVKLGAFSLAMFRLLVFKEVNEWADHLKHWYQKFNYKKHKRIFYTLRRILTQVYSLAYYTMRFIGMYFQLKGKVNSKGGMRKRVFRAFRGRFGSSTLRTVFHYKFKQVWCKTGAIGLKTIIMYRNLQYLQKQAAPNRLTGGVYKYSNLANEELFASRIKTAVKAPLCLTT